MSLAARPIAARRIALRASRTRREVDRLPAEWKLAIGLVLFAGVVMSGFFDSLMIQVIGLQEVDRRVRIATAGAIAAFVGAICLLALSKPVPVSYLNRRKPLWNWPLRIILALVPIWALVGLVNQWPLTYVFGDIFMLAIMPVTYFVLTRRPLDNPRPIFQWLYGMMLFMAIASAALVFYHNLASGGRHKMSLDAAVLPVYYILLKSNPGWSELLLVPVLVLAAIITSKRSTWLALLLAAMLALFLRPGLRRPLRLTFIALLIGATVFLVYREKPEWIEHSSDLLARRWEETVLDLKGGKGSDLASDSGGRMGEVFGAVDTIVARQTLVDWPLGLGLGAIVEARGGRTRHHVHSTPAAFLARTGIIGLLLWMLFQGFVLVELFRRSLRPPSEWHRLQFYFWLGLWISATIFSLKSLSFWGSVLGGIQLAYLSHLCRHADLYTLRKPRPEETTA